MWTATDVEKHAKGYLSDAREWDEWALELGLGLDWKDPEPKPAVHFVRFVEGDQQYQNAVRIFGPPAFVHRHWDHRAQREVYPTDTVVFAKGEADQKPVQWNYDDSNEQHDPAYWERLQQPRAGLESENVRPTGAGQVGQ